MRRRRILGSKIVYRGDSMMAVLVAAGLRHWDYRWLYLKWFERAGYLALLTLFLSLTEPGLTNPKGGQVVSGSAIIGSASPNTLQVDQHTKIVIIDWSSFNIAGSETTRFNQPSATSTAVNRMGGGDPSQILGSLLANGRIVLINGNGILFGPNARIDVGALLATTSDASNADIVSGKTTFDKAGNPNAMIANRGSINASSGMVGLVAPAVRNDGIVTARLGSVTLGASNVFTADFTGDGLISFPLDAKIVSRAIDANGKPVEALVVNNGKIEGTTVLLSARGASNLVTNVISMSGTIAATSVRQEGGKVVLDGGDGGVLVNGTITAVGRTGGTISVTGGDIALKGATLDASGTQGGGTIKIGGWSAKSVTVDSVTKLSASATSNGNGGTISVIAGSTQFAGQADARGGVASGNGGSVETSGHSLDIAGAQIDTFAVSGAAGSWLLDPDDYTIDAAQATTIQSNLASGNVTIMTTASGSGGNGDIFVNSAVSWASANSLTLSAYRNIEVNANIANTAGASVVLHADNTGTGTGTVTFATGTSVSTSGAASILYNPSVNPAGSVVNNSSYVSPTENYSGNVTGGGTLTAYMLVNSVYDLQNIQNNLTGTYALGRDVDASETATWNGGAGFNPVGNYSGTFTGRFDGQGHVIANLTINRPTTEQVGLFGVVQYSVIENVGIFGGRISGSSFVGSLVGSIWSTTIRNDYATSNVTGTGGNVGGLIGWGTSSSVVDSHAGGTVTTPSIASNRAWFTGGLVGNMDGTMSGSYATGVVTGGDWTGGLVGILGGMFPATMSNSYATGNVNGYGHTGGLVGGLGAVGTITGAHSTGDVSGALYGVGGLVGSNSGAIDLSYSTSNVTTSAPIDANPGGLVGWNSGSISHSYATGSVTGLSQVGGLVGRNQDGGTITQSSATGAVSGTGYDIGGLVGGNNGTITQSYATGTVSGGGNVGGLVGSNALYQGVGPAGTITDSHASGTVIGSAGGAGGLVGENDGTIMQSHATGAVSGGGNGVGGLAGGNHGTITQSYATGAVSGYSQVGGLAGWNWGGTITLSYAIGAVSGTGAGSGSVGGLVGQNLESTIMQSYATGAVSGIFDVGGLVGFNWDSSITQSYATGAASGGDNVGGLAGQNGGLVMVGENGGGTIIQSYATGAVSGNLDVGGLVGYSSGTVAQSSATGTVSGSDASVGGLVGANDGSITSSYATGDVSGADDIGGLVGVNDGVIEQSHATGVVSTSSLTNVYDGGLVGNNLGVITQSYATGAVSGPGSADTPTVRSPYPAADSLGPGGVGGLTGGNSGMIEQSYATGAVSGISTVGGLVGANGGTITQSYATGAVNGSGWAIGGLVGHSSGSTITQSYATGSVSGGTDAGGLVGNNSGTITQSYAIGAVSSFMNAGGLVGWNGVFYGGGAISNSYATGDVSGNNGAGGLVGYNYDGTISQSYSIGTVSGMGGVGGLAGGNGGTITYSYWDTQTSGQSIGVGSGDASGVTGLTTAQLSNGTLPNGFDHAVWRAQSGHYPCLLWQAGCIAAPSIATITYAIGDSSSTYGTLAMLGTVTLTGVLASDLANVTPVVSLYDLFNSAVTLSAALNAGTYTAKVTGFTGSAAGNYTIAATGNTDGILIVNPAQLTVAVNDALRLYGDANPAFSAAITGFVLGQDASVLSDLTFSTAATESSDVGTYAITSSGGTATNYVIVSRINGTLTITAGNGLMDPAIIAALRLKNDLGNGNYHIFGPFYESFGQIYLGNLPVSNDNDVACLVAGDLMTCRGQTQNR